MQVLEFLKFHSSMCLIYLEQGLCKSRYQDTCQAWTLYLLLSIHTSYLSADLLRLWQSSLLFIVFVHEISTTYERVESGG